MAIAATIEWEARTTGTASNANSGGFKPGASGTDYSQQDAAQYNLTLVTTAGADAVLLSASAAAVMVGNLAHIISGTNFTAGWYEIISVSVGVSITLDRTCTTAAGAAGVVNIGGALSLGSADDAVFESMEAGNTMHIKAGTYTMGGNVAMAKNGTEFASIILRGYNAARNDNPTGANRPTLAFGANTANFGNYVDFGHLIFTITAANGVEAGTGSITTNCKSTNSSVTAGRDAFSITSAMLIDSEAISTNGQALTIDTTGNCKINGNYLHDSDYGVSIGAADGCVISFNIIDTIVTAGINAGSVSNDHVIMNNSIYGAATPAGSSTGINFAATTGIRTLVMNNIISGFVTGINSAAVVTANLFRNNDLFNNTTNYTNVTAGTGSITTDPGFTDAPNGNFAVGANMKAAAFPGAFPGALSTGYLDIGAVQRQEPAGGGGLLTNPGMSGGMRG